MLWFRWVDLAKVPPLWLEPAEDRRWRAYAQAGLLMARRPTPPTAADGPEYMALVDELSWP